MNNNLTPEENQAIVRDLLQYMVGRYMTDSDQFRRALTAFDVTVVQRYTRPNLDGTTYCVTLFTPMTPDGNRFEFPTEEEADVFAKKNGA